MCLDCAAPRVRQRRKRAAVLPELLLVFAASLLLAAVGHASSFQKGPYLQNVSSRGITIVWQGPSDLPGSVTVHADPPIHKDSPPQEIHEVTISGLAPGRRYRYTVSVGEEVLQGQFATAPLAGSPFSFVVYGDSRSNAYAHTRVVERIRQESPDFALGTGDVVNEGAKEEDWQLFFDIERDLLRETVLFPSVGNHDRQGRGRTASNFRKYFSLPENSPDPERYYSFTYASALFLVLDSNAYSFALTDQTAWIERELQAARLDPKIEHIFVTMHHPPYSVSLHGGQSDLREAWTPLFERYKVAAVFSGHDHVYSRAERNNVRYFVSGGGGAPLYGRKSGASALDQEANRFFERVNHHLRVRVIGQTVEVVAIRADGTFIEAIRWGQDKRLSRAELLRSLPDAPALAAPEQKTVAQGPTTKGKPEQVSVGILGFLGICMTIGSLTIAFWVWRSA